MQSEKKISLTLTIAFICILISAGVFSYFYFLKPKVNKEVSVTSAPTLKVKRNVYERLIKERGLPEKPKDSDGYGRDNPFSDYK
ncbi:MAG: hypothetical protein AAB360_01120 [Patescibacteria group bacterium]